MNQFEIGKFIAQMRKEKGMTQEELAEIMGVTDKSVSRWENGKTLPDISLLVELSEVLNISLGELLKGKRLNRDEPVEEKELIDNIIDYDNDKKNMTQRKFMTKLGVGLFITSLAILNNYYDYLRLIFTPNIAEFVQGLMFGIGIEIELISAYNMSHELSLRERKKLMKNKMQNKN